MRRCAGLPVRETHAAPGLRDLDRGQGARPRDCGAGRFRNRRLERYGELGRLLTPIASIRVCGDFAYSDGCMSRVNILGEALDGLGRWYVAVPPFLIIGFLAALFFLTGAGQARLQEASERLRDSTTRELAIEGLAAAVARSVAVQRAFLLTGDEKFLSRSTEVIADVEPSLDRALSAYEAPAADLTDVRTLQVLSGKRLGDLSTLIAVQKAQGPAAAVALVKTSVGTDTGEAINGLLDQLRGRES